MTTFGCNSTPWALMGANADHTVMCMGWLNTSVKFGLKFKTAAEKTAKKILVVGPVAYTFFRSCSAGIRKILLLLIVRLYRFSPVVHCHVKK